jgi:aquaporin related protein
MTTRPKPQNHYLGQDRDSNSSPRHTDHAFHYEEQDRQKHRKMKTLKNHIVASTGEFVGTFMFLYFAFTTHLMISDQASDVGRNGGPSAQTVIFISLGYGFSLLITVWGWYRVSGGVFNPAVSWIMFSDKWNEADSIG